MLRNYWWESAPYFWVWEGSSSTADGPARRAIGAVMSALLAVELDARREPAPPPPTSARSIVDEDRWTQSSFGPWVRRMVDLLGDGSRYVVAIRHAAPGSSLGAAMATLAHACARFATAFHAAQVASWDRRRPLEPPRWREQSEYSLVPEPWRPYADLARNGYESCRALAAESLRPELVARCEQGLRVVGAWRVTPGDVVVPALAAGESGHVRR